jgi:hypothetical protein
MFTGWIESADGSKLTISTNSPHAVAIGDEFHIEGVGNKIAMTARVKLDRVGQLDLSRDGQLTAIAGTNSRVVEAKRVLLYVTLVGGIRFTNTTENLRLKTSPHVLSIKGSMKEAMGVCLDVSREGMGLSSPVHYKVDSELGVTMQSKFGMIVCKGMVRYCSPDRDRIGMYRCGLMLLPLERTIAPRWDQLLNDPE